MEEAYKKAADRLGRYTSLRVERTLAVVIPCYSVRDHVLEVIGQIGPEVADLRGRRCLPRQFRRFVDGNARPARPCCAMENQGVGGAVMTGYQAAIADGAAVIVKVDGDGQMDPRLIPKFIAPIGRRGRLHQGNRFHTWKSAQRMPPMRLLGNAALSLPDQALERLLEHVRSDQRLYRDPRLGAASCRSTKISRRYFFETDMLFGSTTLRAVVRGRADGSALRRRSEQPQVRREL